MANLLSALTPALIQASGAEVILRSQLAPDIRIDLASATQPAPPAPPGVASKISEWFMASVVRPEIEINVPAVGIRKRISPWGTPTTDYSPVLAIGLGVGVIGAGLLAWKLFRS